MATSEQLDLPRGIRIFTEPQRDWPHAVQWRVDGKRKTRFFETTTARDKYAVSLKGDVKRDGLAALRLNPEEAREWRSFRADLGDAPLPAVLACWRKHGAHVAAVPLASAIRAFTAAKKGEGVSVAHLAHFDSVFDRLKHALGPVSAGAVTRAQLSAFFDQLGQANSSLRTNFARIRSFFRWLKATRQIPENPFDGLKAPKEIAKPVSVLSVEHGRLLFAKNMEQPREVLGRLALEAFAGVRHETAAKLPASAIDFTRKIVTIPAAIDKNRSDQWIEAAPDNLWPWLKWSAPDKWSMPWPTYRNAKCMAFVRAGVPHPRNVLRHSFASYHIAMNGDAGKTAAILTHANLRMLWKHYRGKGGGEQNGKAWFAILP